MNNNNFDIEKFKKLAAVVSEDELDTLLDENTVGAGSSADCADIIIKITGVVIGATSKFDWCPTSACTYSCRF